MPGWQARSGPQQRARQRQPHIDISLPVLLPPFPLSPVNKVVLKSTLPLRPHHSLCLHTAAYLLTATFATRRPAATGRHRRGVFPRAPVHNLVATTSRPNPKRRLVCPGGPCVTGGTRLSPYFLRRQRQHQQQLFGIKIRQWSPV